MGESRNITDRIRPWVENVIDKHGQGDVLAWEASIAPANGGLMLLVAMWMPSPVLGELLSVAVGVPDPLRMSANQVGVEGVVHRLIEQLRTLRSKVLDGTAKADGNGQAKTVLHLPGGTG